MTHIVVTVTQTLHVHGMAMDAAVSHAITVLGTGNSPSRIELTAKYVGDDRESQQ